MVYEKVIPVGPSGSLTISESAGVASVVFSLSEMSGGSLEGVAKAQVSAQAQIDAKHLIDIGLALIESKYPAAAPILAGLQAIFDAEVASI